MAKYARKNSQPGLASPSLDTPDRKLLDGNDLLALIIFEFCQRKKLDCRVAAYCRWTACLDCITNTKKRKRNCGVSNESMIHIAWISQQSTCAILKRFNTLDKELIVHGKQTLSINWIT
jgi:hypothetical protein